MGERRRWLQHPCGACVCVCVFFVTFGAAPVTGCIENLRRPKLYHVLWPPLLLLSLSLRGKRKICSEFICTLELGRLVMAGGERTIPVQSVSVPCKTHRPIGGPDPTGSGVASLCRALVYAAASVRMSAGSTSALCTKNCTLCYYSPVPIWCIHGIYAAKATGRRCRCR